MESPLILIVSLVAFWGLALLGIKAMKRTKNPRQTDIAYNLGPRTHKGVDFTFRLYSQWISDHERYTWLDCMTQLPSPLNTLGLVEGEGLRLRTRLLSPADPIQTIGAPNTSDRVFNGIFDLTSPPEDAATQALNNAEVRRIFTTLAESFSGLWIDEGQLRVMQRVEEDSIMSQTELLELNLDVIVAFLRELTEVLSEGGLSSQVAKTVEASALRLEM